MPAFPPPPEPKSLLDFKRILSPTAGVRVSPLCLGAMNFGDAWEDAMGKCDRKMSYEMMDFFYENGGNFIDTSNNYQNEESEIWIGEWMAERKNRDEMVIATKFTTLWPDHRKPDFPKQRINFTGNSTKSLVTSVRASLKKLQTDYIDLLYVHWWDFSTGVEELMQSLNHLVQRGQVLYLGVSDTPAWVVSKANEYARNHGLRQFSVYQGQWSAADRDFERDILPMARAEGMALAPWGSLGGGNFTTEEKRKNDEKGRNMRPPNERQLKLSKKLEQVAKKHGTLITSVAMAYIMAKGPYIFPIVGGRKVEHLKGNIEALSLELSDEEVDEIDAESGFEVGFPMSFLFEYGGGASGKYSSRMTTGDVGLLKMAGKIDSVPQPRPIKPHGLKG